MDGLLDRRAGRLLAVAALLALGAAVRLLGIRFGLPFHHHWDEPFVIDSAADMLRHGNNVPRSYMYGAPLARLTVYAFTALGWLEGRASSPLTPHDAQVTLYLLARLVTAAISASGVVAMYFAGRSLDGDVRRGTAIGLASALLYAVSWELVLHSRFAAPDGCMTGLTAWTLGLTGVYLATRRLVWGVAALLAAGVTFSFKLPGLVSALIPLGALFLTAGPAGGRRGLVHRGVLLAAVPLVLGCYALLNPHVVDRTVDAIRDIAARLAQVREGGVSPFYRREAGLAHLAAASWAIASNFPHRSAAVSLVVTAVSVFGWVRGARERRVLILVAVAQALAATLSNSLENRAFLIRNYVIVMPAVCLGFGLGATRLAELVSRRLAPAGPARRAAAAAALVVVAAVLVVLPVADAIGAERLRRDSRAMALDWIAEHAPRAAPADVALTPGVLGKTAVGWQPDLAHELERPGLRLSPAELDACPGAPGPEYIVDASYRDIARADPSDTFAEQWLFSSCPGYERVAAYGPSPYEHDEAQTPNWNGRVSAVVLRRSDVR